MADTIDNDLRNEIINYFQQHQNEVDNLHVQIKNKDIIVFLGNTRSGKSTLVNYMIGTKLEALESRKREYKIRKLNFDDIGPEIGQGSPSCSALPTMYKVEGNDNEYIVDLPGFEDNRGIVQDIANVFFINQIRYAKTVKFVVVFDIFEIANDNVRHFTKTLEYIQDLVINSGELKNSFCFIFTKDSREYTQEEIINMLKNKILNVEGLKMNKLLVRNVAANEKFIGIFRMPTNSGTVSPNVIDMNVKNAIKSIHSIDIEKCKIKFTISDSANGVLLQIYSDYIESNYFDSEISRLTQAQDSYFDVDKYVYASYDDELEITQEILSNTRREIEAEIANDLTTLIDVKNSLNTLFVNVMQSAITNDFITNFKFVILMEDSKLMEDSYRTKIITNYKISLENNRNRISMMIQKIIDEKTDRSSIKFIFNACITAGVLGGIPLLAGVFRAIKGMSTTGSILQNVAAPGSAAFTAAEAVVGTAAATCISLAGAAVAGTAVGGMYVSYKELHIKRANARQLQGRD